MKKIIIYSSLTGNTKKVCEAVAANLGCSCVRFDEQMAQNWAEFDLVILGFWIDKGFADNEMRKFISQIKDKNLGLIITLGGNPNSERFKDTISRNSEELLKNGNTILEAFACQGKISDEIIAKMREMAANNPNLPPQHQITPETEARWAEAAKHPDENDLKNAIQAFARFK